MENQERNLREEFIRMIIPDLIEIAKTHKNPEERKTAVMTLLNFLPTIDDDRILPALIDILKTSPDAEVRHMITDTIAYLAKQKYLIEELKGLGKRAREGIVKG